MGYVVGLPNNSYKPFTNTTWVRAQLCKLEKGCTRLEVASVKVYQLLAHGRWFSPGTPASSTTKTGRHDIAESGVKHNKSINQPHRWCKGYLTRLESGQTKDYKIGICCFSAKHVAWRRESKDWLARNQDNVSEWGDMSIHRLLFQWDSIIKSKLLQSGHHRHLLIEN